MIDKIPVSIEAKSYAHQLLKIADYQNAMKNMLYLTAFCMFNAILYAVGDTSFIASFTFIILAGLALYVFARANKLSQEAQIELEENYELD